MRLLLFLLYTSEHIFSILENKLIYYADISTLIVVVPSPGVTVSVAESQNRDLGKVWEWCDVWMMKLNASKTKTMTLSRSRTMHLFKNVINDFHSTKVYYLIIAR